MSVKKPSTFSSRSRLLTSQDMKSCFDPVVDMIIKMVANQVQAVRDSGSPPVQVGFAEISSLMREAKQLRTLFLSAVLGALPISGSE